MLLKSSRSSTIHDRSIEDSAHNGAISVSSTSLEAAPGAYSLTAEECDYTSCYW